MSKNKGDTFSTFAILFLFFFIIGLCVKCCLDFKKEDEDRDVCYQIKDDAECPKSCEKLAIAYGNPQLPCSCFKSANMLVKEVPFRCFNK